MRAQCCICSDLFISDPDVNIAAVQCGHTFHEECLMRWLKTSGTCPSCRSQVNQRNIIKKLFFDVDPEAKDEEDPSLLTNQVQELKLQLRKKDKELSTSKADQQSEEEKQKVLKKSIKELEKMVKMEQTSNSSLKKQLQLARIQQEVVEQEKKECYDIKRKLVHLQNVEKLVTGSESEAKDIISSSGSGENACKDLSVYCAMLKREYENVKSDKKSIKAEFEKLRRDCFSKDRQFEAQKKELTFFKDSFHKSEEDLKNVEKERDVLKKKLSHLRHSIMSPKANLSASSSFIETLNESTPLGGVVGKAHIFQSLVEDTPDNNEDIKENRSKKRNHSVLCTPEVVKSNSRIEISPDHKVEPSPNTQMKRHCAEIGVKYIKITEPGASQPAKKPKNEDVSDISSFAHFNILKKKSRTGDFNSVLRNGYDGLGGHTTFAERKSSLASVNAIKKSNQTSSNMTRKPKLVVGQNNALKLKDYWNMKS